MTEPIHRFYQFDAFCIDARKRVLLRDGELVPLTPKAFDLLLVLLKHRGQVLEKDDLMEKLWPDSNVEEANLPIHVSSLRKALGESPNERRYIVTIPGRGYRFAADVEELKTERQEWVVERYAKNTIVIQEPTSAIDPNRTLPSHLIIPRRSKAALIGVFILAATILASGLLLWLSRDSVGKLPQTQVKSLAVLPFMQSGGGYYDYMGLGIADSLITKLSNLNKIKVRPTSSVIKYSNQSDDVSQIGRELGVEAVLEGSVRRDGDKVRITVQLVRVEDGSPLWAEKFDDTFTGIFQIEDSMSRRVAESLLLKLTGEEKAVLTKRYTDNVEAYNEYLMGRMFWNKRTIDGIKKAIEHFDNAITLDPNYALAYAGLADCHIVLYSYSDHADKEEIPKSKEAATKAIQTDATLSEAHTALGYVLYSEHDYAGAEKEYKRAIELNPHDATAYHRYAILQLSAGRSDDALQLIKRAQELDPLSLIINTALGQIYSFNGRYAEAIEQLRQTLEMDSSFIHARGFLGLAYLKKGMYEDAIREIEKAAAPSGNPVPRDIVSCRGFIDAVTGKRAEAKKILRDLTDLRKERHVSAAHIALIYTGLGETDQAFKWLNTAYQERDLGFGWLNHPGFDGLRSDSRFADLARRIGIQQ